MRRAHFLQIIAAWVITVPAAAGRWGPDVRGAAVGAGLRGRRGSGVAQADGAVGAFGP